MWVHDTILNNQNWCYAQKAKYLLRKLLEYVCTDLLQDDYKEQPEMPLLPCDTCGRQYSLASLCHIEPNLFEVLTETNNYIVIGHFQYKHNKDSCGAQDYHHSQDGLIKLCMCMSLNPCPEYKWTIIIKDWLQLKNTHKCKCREDQTMYKENEYNVLSFITVSLTNYCMLLYLYD